MMGALRSDLQAARERDPAARSTAELVLCYPGVHAVWGHRVSHSLWRRSEDRHRSAWDLFVANSEVYLDAASTNPAYRQIVLIDGPAVLGWNSLSERGDGPTHQIMGYLRDAVEEGVLSPQPLEPLAHLLSALGTGAALYVAHAADPEAARREVAECNERFLSGLGVHTTVGTAEPGGGLGANPSTEPN